MLRRLLFLISLTVPSVSFILHHRRAVFKSKKEQPILTCPNLSRAREDRKDNSDENNPEVAARLLLEKAQQLRNDITQFEKERESFLQTQKSVEQQKKQEDDKRRQAWKDTYSVVVPILKDDGREVQELVDFAPYYNSSYIWTCETTLPLGIILEQKDCDKGSDFGSNKLSTNLSAHFLTVVEEVTEGSEGDKASIQVGDILRACTACRTVLKTPTWQLLVGGIGMPETRRFLYAVDNRPLEEILQAIGSNRMDPQQRPVFFVWERSESEVKGE
jgi:hypothetical protein